MALRSIDQELAAVVHEATKWSGEFARLAQAFSAGIAPDKEQARKVGTQIGEQGKKLKAILDEMEQSKDFQAMEAYYTLEVQARRAKAPSMRAIEQLVNWQAAGLIAFADGRPLAPMPPGVDPTAMQAAAPGTAGGDTKTRVLYEPGTPRMLPFSEDDFDAVPGEAAAFLKAEFQRLSRDHRQLVGLGETYRDFDATGKEFYLGQMAQLAFRWEELLERAQRAGVRPNPAYLATSEEYLRRASLTPEGFRGLVEDVHALLQEQVEQQKLRGF